jgi:hypothetical protein
VISLFKVSFSAFSAAAGSTGGTGGVAGGVTAVVAGGGAGGVTGGVAGGVTGGVAGGVAGGAAGGGAGGVTGGTAGGVAGGVTGSVVTGSLIALSFHRVGSFGLTCPSIYLLFCCQVDAPNAPPGAVLRGPRAPFQLSAFLFTLFRAATVWPHECPCPGSWNVFHSHQTLSLSLDTDPGVVPNQKQGAKPGLTHSAEA